jgi:hypothetical protein
LVVVVVVVVVAAAAAVVVVVIIIIHSHFQEGLATYIMNGARPALNHAWPVELRAIIAACWSENPADRPTFRTILEKWNDLTIDFLCPDPLGRKICHIFWRTV